MITLNRNLGALPASRGNEVTLYPDYGESIEAMTAAVDGAQHFVHVQFYITAWDSVTGPFFDALIRATDRGVTVRLLFDYLGSKGIPGYKDMLTRLDQTRIAWRAMLPIGLRKGQLRRPDLRNHRKILVVDGCGGLHGLAEPHRTRLRQAEESSGRPRMGRADLPRHGSRRRGARRRVRHGLVQRDRRDADGRARPSHSGNLVGDLTCQVIPSGPGFATENNLRAFTTLLYSARRRISITSPYFVPDESLLYAVTTAAHRGVEVELFVSEEGDQFMVYHAQCSYYDALLEAGVRIYLYPAPYVLHSKHFSIDDDVAVLGSSNMDLRSFGLNYEVSMMLGGGRGEPHAEGGGRLSDQSRELTLEEWSGAGGLGTPTTSCG